jgi:hypothetical protein
MGQLDQFAKRLFEAETATLTHGALAWQTPPEIGLAEVRLDGLLLVRRPEQLTGLLAPWPLAEAFDEIVVELKMPGDHLDLLMLERALLRRQARQVQRLEKPASSWRGQEPLWLVAPHLPRWLHETREVRPVGPGCYQLDRAPFTVLWVAANELPLADELVPFLVARSSSALDAFARWIAPRRPFAWVVQMVQFLPMSMSVQEEVLAAFPKTDDPEILARQRHIARVLTRVFPEVGQELREEGVEQGIKQGIEQGIGQGIKRGQLQMLRRRFERRLDRPLTTTEQVALAQRFDNVGADRLEDLALDLPAEALVAWLNDSHAV